MYYDSWVECQNGTQQLKLMPSDQEYYFTVPQIKGMCMKRQMMLEPNFYIVYLVFNQSFPRMKVYLDGRQFYINESQQSICSIVFYHDKNNFTLDIVPDEQAFFQFYLIGTSPNLSKLKFGLQNLTSNALISSNIDQLYLKSKNFSILDNQTIEVQDNYAVQTNCTGGLQFFVSVQNQNINSQLIQGQIQQILILKYNLTIKPQNHIQTLETQTKIALLQNSLFKYSNENQYPQMINSSRSILICQKQYMPEVFGFYPIKLINNGTKFIFEQVNTLQIVISLKYLNENDIKLQNLKDCFNQGINLDIKNLQINNQLLSKYNNSLSQNDLTITLWIEFQIKSNITLSVEGTINFTNPKELYYEFDVEDFYEYDTLDNNPSLLFLILIANLTWFIGSFFVLIYLRYRHKLDPNTDLIGLRNQELE